MATDYNQIRKLIDKKNEQIKQFEKDKGLPEKEKSFSTKQYDEMIEGLQADIKELEGVLDNGE